MQNCGIVTIQWKLSLLFDLFGWNKRIERDGPFDSACHHIESQLVWFLLICSGSFCVVFNMNLTAALPRLKGWITSVTVLVPSHDVFHDLAEFGPIVVGVLLWKKGR